MECQYYVFRLGLGLKNKAFGIHIMQGSIISDKFNLKWPESQLLKMDATLEKLMNMRLKLTCVQKEPPKYDPPVIFKEHYMSHLPEDIRNLAPIPYLKTDLFESKVSKETS